jgi:hypothetical protein
MYNFGKKTMLVQYVLLLSLTVLAQSNIDSPHGRKFLKRIENNLLNDACIISDGKILNMYNLASKTDIENLFFGDFNAIIEFFINPSFEGAYGFRIFKDSSNNCTVESKRISNWDTVWSQLDKEFPSISIKATEEHLMTGEEKDRIRCHNRAMFDKQIKESVCRYEVENQSFSVSNLFAEKLYAVIVDAINNFVGKGVPASIRDGYSATLRCVVADEVWTLTVHSPQGVILQLTDVCRQLIEDIKSNNVDESHYITVFEKITSFVKQ